MGRATGVLPTKETAATPGRPEARPRPRVAVDHVEHAVGHPGLVASSASSNEGEGSFSDGLRMNALPQAKALAIIHSGTMTGKLNGVIPATTPSGSSTVCTSTPLDTSLEYRALEQVGEAAGELDVLQAPGHLTGGVAQHLAVLGRHRGGQIGAARATRSRKRNRTAALELSEPGAPLGRRLGGHLDRAVHLGLGGQRNAAVCTP